MVLKVTSLKIDSELLKEVKIKATQKEITQTELITEYLKQGLKNDDVE